MQEFLQESGFRAFMDSLGFHILTAAGCLGWFTLLWGVTLPSLLAGGALWGLVLLIRRKTRDGRLKRKEKNLRRRIGGEMALEEALLLPARQAHDEIAVLLGRYCPLTLLRAGESGALCILRQEKVLLRLCPLPAAARAGAEEVLSLQRAVREAGAARGILCVPCGLSPAASAQAKGPVPVSFLYRDTLIRLLGEAYPVTDRQLVELGRRRRQSPGAWLPVILHPGRAPRYLGYGALLMGMRLLTGQVFYAFPGLLCWGLAAACRCVGRKEEIL